MAALNWASISILALLSLAFCTVLANQQIFPFSKCTLPLPSPYSLKTTVKSTSTPSPPPNGRRSGGGSGSSGGEGGNTVLFPVPGGGFHAFQFPPLYCVPLDCY